MDTARTRTRRPLACALASALLLASATIIAGPEPSRGARGGQNPDRTAAPELDTIQVRPNLFMIAGGGGNVTVQIGSDGVILVDAGAAASADAMLAAIRRLTDKPIRYIIDTSADADHVGGNAVLSRSAFDERLKPKRYSQVKAEYLVARKARELGQNRT